MERTVLKFKLNNKLFIRDPQETELGNKIMEHSILLIDSLGFEHFTFKKLAIEIESTEASIYRYFENKNRLLIYLVSWYWSWMDYKIQFYTNNITSPEEKLKVIIKTICETNSELLEIFFNERALHRIVIAESVKVYLIKEVDEVNKEGIYFDYKNLNGRIAKLILEVKPDFIYANALVSTLIETAHQQSFFAEHLPSLTNISNGTNMNVKLQEYLELLLWSSLNNTK